MYIFLFIIFLFKILILKYFLKYFHIYFSTRNRKRWLEPAFDFKRFGAVCMIVSKRCKPLPTAKATFVGRSEKTSQTLSYFF